MVAIKANLAKERIPLATIIPNMAIPAPPNTAFGMLATIAANLGNKPNKIKITPDAATTKRLLTPVTAIRPTF